VIALGLAHGHFFWRADLHRVLAEEAVRRGVAIEYGKRLVNAEETGDGVTAHFADGTDATGDILVGADDGIHSIVGSMENMPRVRTWSRGRMVLVGDSVHAPSSSSGQGASLAIESAIQLARCLRDLPHARAFAAYEAQRRPRVERVIKETTRKNSDKTAGPVLRVVNAWAIRVFGKLVKPEKMTWMFQYHIDWDAPASAASPVTAS
jgi:2-polyprenyl-6-methoxyphenol hydroxylase-like FAD-dependent oxidoreductase